MKHYERGALVGYRNGNRLGRLKTAEGIVEYAVSRVTGTAEPWAGEVNQALFRRTEELERLGVEMYARGLSIRDIEAAFTEADRRCVLSKSAASQVTERLWEDCLNFANRDFRACAEFPASEHASRLLAMQNTERNIEDKLAASHTLYHQQRQEAITTEMLDVIVGFEAMAESR